MGLAVIRSPWRSGRVPAPHCIHVEYLSALPALTAVAVAKQSLVASNATYYPYGLEPLGPYGLRNNNFLDRWDVPEIAP